MRANRLSGPRHQKGAAAIEFAAVFVIFFALFYALVSYSLPLLMVQSFNAATSEAVRRSVALSPSIGTVTYNALVLTQAKTTVQNQLTWMPASLNFAPEDIKVTLVNGLLTVSIQYPTSKLTQVLPLLILPVIGEVPRLPAVLSAQASLQLVP
ncbi:pilus assembly protein [Pseudomonas syringae]|nr:pilus assembly protein [Pseudomonas syringae]MBD8575457.1 pilus assembly protein [Pseudomonas syringae]MBD8788764.1 pilus assembly protein [Pseudomonas syringae]MBD8803935.1 pilus assembly protein [Pseudomonas syringae]MBD8811233.1 pilus assembly protein [Pseudomonas syringae]